MDITIRMQPQEVATLVVALQERRNIPPEEFDKMLEAALVKAAPGVILPEN